MALAMIMTNAPSSEVAATFKEAYGRYSHLTNSGTNRELVRYTTRAMMLAAEYAKQQGDFTEANYALMKAHYQVCSSERSCKKFSMRCTGTCNTNKSPLPRALHLETWGAVAKWVSTFSCGIRTRVMWTSTSPW